MTAHLRQLTLAAAMIAAVATPVATMAEERGGPDRVDLRFDARVAHGLAFDEGFVRAADDAGQRTGSGGQDIPWVRVLRTERPPARAWPRLGELVRASFSGSPPVFASFEDLLRP